VHELSVAIEVCRMAEERLGPHGSSRLRLVALEVGDDAGLEIENLSFCLEALLVQPPFGQARPSIRRLPGDDLRIDYMEIEDDGPDD
jgi:Zn finger protein HypA/HybF involved in hydrogenase expression